MKKKAKEVEDLHVLRNNKKDCAYSGNEIIAQDSLKKLKEYKDQLLKAGYEDVFEFDTVESDRWSTTIRFMDSGLERIDGFLYPKYKIKRAKTEKNKFLCSIKSVCENLESMGKDNEHYNYVIEDLKKQHQYVQNQPLELEMI